ncbi:MAG: DUF4271 domain-containing protein, partial [Tannerella sp.]|nr:DUF4271 domain-containing protein [Tannerella sp.]
LIRIKSKESVNFAVDKIANETLMNDIDFDGYPGIYLNKATFSDDIILLVVLILLSTFALIFRLNLPLFGKTINNIHADEQRQSIFDTTQRDSFLFNLFMKFQTLFLGSILIFLVSTDYNFFINPDTKATILIITCLFVALLAFYLLKRCLYGIFGYIFLEKDIHRMMFVNYQALFCIWGISLYFPILWILLIGGDFYIACIIFIISYLSFRATFIYRFIHIFFYKNTGLLLLSLYLCSQEIIPLIFLYEGLIYMYNIIETNNIWQ